MPAQRPLDGGPDPESDSETSSAPSRGRLMTAIALMICRLPVTEPTGLSYHGGAMSPAAARRYSDIAALERAYAGA